RKIKQHPSVATLYAERLIREGGLTAEEADALRKQAAGRFSAAFDAVQQNTERYELQELSAVSTEEIAAVSLPTAVDLESIDRIVEGITRFPEDFHLHPKLRGFVEKRREALRDGGSIDWAFAEALSFGSLVLEGTPVRLSGQDSGRGTFSQRHLA